MSEPRPCSDESLWVSLHCISSQCPGVTPQPKAKQAAYMALFFCLFFVCAEYNARSVKATISFGFGMNDENAGKLTATKKGMEVRELYELANGD